MKRFKSIRHAQRFLSTFSGISPHFRPRRHLLSAADYRQVMADRFAIHYRDEPLNTVVGVLCAVDRDLGGPLHEALGPGEIAGVVIPLRDISGAGRVRDVGEIGCGGGLRHFDSSR